MCLVCLLLCTEEGSSPMSLQLLRGMMWACLVKQVLSVGGGALLDIPCLPTNVCVVPVIPVCI